MRVNFVVWGREGESVPCVCSIRFINHFVAARNTRASAALGELALVIPCCRTADQFSRLFLPASVGLWNLLPLSVFSGGTLSSFKSAINLYLLRA